MKYNKGFAPIVILVAILVAGAIGGVAYYAGKSQKTSENKIVDNYQPVNNNTYQQNTPQANTPKPKNNPPPQQQQTNSCLVITSPTVNSVISFPITLVGYIDVAGAAAGTCTRWGAFEGTAGDVVVRDTNGNAKSLAVKINTIGGYYIGMQHWPVNATIQSLTGVPYTNEIRFHMAGDEQRDGFLPATQILGSFTVTPYP